MNVRPARKTHGVVYTPASIVRHILRHTLDVSLHASSAGEAPLLLDPACGDGAFLIEAARRLLDHAREATCESRLALLRRHVFGMDIDGAAVLQARRRLAAVALGLDDRSWSPAEEQRIDRAAESLLANLRCDDALAPSTTPPLLRPGAFTVIVSNPPFVGVRRLARRGVESQGCDLYVRFVERIVELLAEGGRFGLVAPNKIAVADYARPCRELLLRTTRLERLDDISALGAFPAVSVYPVILCGVKMPPAGNRIAVTWPRSMPDLGNAGDAWTFEQARIDAAEGIPLRPPLDVESRVPTQPLGDVATLHSGATGFTAARLAEALVEQDDASGAAWDFITSGNIDRYTIHAGAVRFLGRVYRRPVLPAAASLLTPRKRRLYGEPKIVLAGMSRRLEAAWRETGLALGVQVFAAAELRDDPYFMLGLLNSKLLAFFFRTRFQAKRLAGGYLSVNKGQLARLPIRRVDPADKVACRRRRELSQLARKMSHIGKSDKDRTTLDDRMDQLVYWLYALTKDEIVMVEEELNATY